MSLEPTQPLSIDEQDDVVFHDLSDPHLVCAENHPSTSSEEPPSLKRKAAKGLIDLYPEEEPAYPDLADYFMNYEMSHEDQIRMCRAYASYLVSLYPKKKKQK